jgi:hypothetical protein
MNVEPAPAAARSPPGPVLFNKLVAGACYGLVQYSRYSPRSTSAAPSCPQAAAATATNSHPTTSCPRNGVPAGAAANAGRIVPLPGVAGGGRRRKPMRRPAARSRLTDGVVQAQPAAE